MLSPPDFGTNIIKHDLHVCCPYCTVSVLAPFLELGSHKSGFMKVVAEESRDGGKFIREYAKPWLPGVLPIQTRFVNSTSKYSWSGYGLWSTSHYISKSKVDILDVCILMDVDHIMKVMDADCTHYGCQGCSPCTYGCYGCPVHTLWML